MDHHARTRPLYAPGADARSETVASTSKVPFVDMIKIIDPERDVLLNWVHLSKRGNEIVAAAFAREIEKFTCH